MKIIGIIAEYNPFHNGHAYQIKKIKEDLQADFVVVAMSGDFVQRGAPAIIDKYARAQMALSCGADLVIELPVLWATASAEYFSMAGVTLFDKMGCIDGICFGAETDNLEVLSMIADVLACEPDYYRTALTSYLKSGMAFPSARSKALCDYFAQNVSDSPDKNVKINLDELSSILNEPNNILGIEYLKALKRRNSSITPYIIKRKGAGYHDPKIAIANSCTSDNTPTASATAIRKALDTDIFINDLTISDELSTAIPALALDILKSYASNQAFICSNDFSSILGYKLLSSNAGDLADIGDSNIELANRLLKNRMNFTTFEQFCERNKSKDVTYTRISRILLHLILDIKTCDYTFGKELDYIPYLRMLGFRKDSSALLKALKHCSVVPIISKLADATSFLSADAVMLLEKDIFAADLYSQVCANISNTSPNSEFTKNIILT